MKVLSLFDGMSCGRIALDQLGIPVEKYYASEIDKYAIQVSQANYPEIVQVGDICNLDAKDYQDVDLIIAGSPCQGFSFAGKQLAFDDPRSALFFEFIRLLKEIKPKYFLLENVRMKKEFLQVISQQVSECYPEIAFGIEPIFINSSLLSAQSRQRFYWTNIPGIQEPEDQGIVLRDILEDNPENEFYYSKKSRDYMERGNEKWQQAGKRRADRYEQSADKEKSFTITANWHKGVPYNYFKESKPIKVGMNVEEVKVRKHEVNISGLQHLLRQMKKESGKTNKQIAKETNMPVTKAEHWFRTDSSFAIPGDNIWLKLKEVLGIKTNIFDKEVMEFEYRDGVYETKQRVYSENGKSPTITASNTEQYIETKPKQIGIATDINGHDILKRVYSPDGKSPTVNTCQGGNREPKVVTGGAFRGRAYDNKGKRMDRDGSSVANKTTQMLELRKDDKSNAITTVGKDSVVVEESKLREKSKTVRSGGRGSYDRHEWDSVDELHWRKLTPKECERLQTVPDDYTNHVSNTQRYKMLGNGWTVAVIKHIFQNMDYEGN
ncbi:DNA (cytosine-5-)-methyltransferase [bacterium]|nr:DNA (cytosine-5-)-methyltransferase [bacterium]